eukprot:TRINITY_DN56282_c0_g1_i1.p1 TRINITY_DN56282_c0_g1~~TRINITY_DN56282_c0_g1_i1.p1  ORF type:complete len:1238 (-),score=237.78 TRINITY_DN56282_c0_g1_i1:121-3834(-)
MQVRFVRHKKVCSETPATAKRRVDCKAFAAWVTAITVADVGASASAVNSDPGKEAADAAWAQLEFIATTAAVGDDGETVLEWSNILERLSDAHPHHAASGILAWLHFFGLPDGHGRLQLPSGVPRDVDRAVAFAREGARLKSPTCGRCYALLGLLLSVGYPPLVNFAHATTGADGRPVLIFLSNEILALPPGSVEVAALPRDIGPIDPAASAYALAAAAGDAVGVLAVAYLSRQGLINVTSLRAPGPNQAAAMTPRKPRSFVVEAARETSCDPDLVASLGELAAAAIDESQRDDGGPWNGPAPRPLAEAEAAAASSRDDAAWLQHVLADPVAATAEDLAAAADRLDAGGPVIAAVAPAAVRAAEVAAMVAPSADAKGSPPSSRNGRRPAAELRSLAASRGDPRAALQAAVEHLQINETSEARPFLEKVIDGGNAADAEMARYYHRRYVAEEPDAAAAWPHLERAADLGRADAELLVAHAHAQGGVALAGDDGGGNDDQRAQRARSEVEAARRYRRIVEGAHQRRGRRHNQNPEGRNRSGIVRNRSADNRSGIGSADRESKVPNGSSQESRSDNQTDGGGSGRDASHGARGDVASVDDDAVVDAGDASGRLSEIQAFAAYNLGVLLLKNTSFEDQESNFTSGQENGNAKVALQLGNTSRRDVDGNLSSDEANGSSGAAINGSDPGSEANGDNQLPKPPLAPAETTLVLDGPAPCSLDAQRAFEDVVLSRLSLIRIVLVLAQRSARLGDTTGALLLSMLLSDVGHPVGHADAAFLWDSWARHRPQHMGQHREQEEAAAAAARRQTKPCDLSGWWTTGASVLAAQNISRVLVASVEGGGFEMFNASLDAGINARAFGLNASETVIPTPERSQFRHLHSFLWHTTYEVLPDGAPVPVALQPPAAVPHLVEHHHQRGKLFADESCSTMRVEGMWVNWTFHRLGVTATSSPVNDSSNSGSSDIGEDSACSGSDGVCFQSKSGGSTKALAGQEFLHCWVRPEWYFAALHANLAVPPQPSPGFGESSGAGGWTELLSLTTSTDCPCRGAFGCRHTNGACVAATLPGGHECPTGAKACPEVAPSLEPVGKPRLAAEPEVCALAFHRRSAVSGEVAAMHVLSHAYSNGLRGAPRDAAEAFHWSQRAMETGDARGRFDVAYSLEFGLGVEANPSQAYKIYNDLLRARGDGSFDDGEPENIPIAARISSLVALVSASGRYIAGRLLGGAWADHTAPWAPATETAPASGA